MIKYLLAILCTCFTSLALATTPTLPNKNMLLATKMHWHIGSTAEQVKITNATDAAFNVIIAVDYFVTPTNIADAVLVYCPVRNTNYSVVRGSSIVCLLNPAQSVLITPGAFAFGSSGTYALLV